MSQIDPAGSSNNPNGPNEPSPPPGAPGAPDAQQVHVPVPKRKRHRVLKVLGVLVLLLIVLVVCAPWIASTGPVRSMVVSQINNNLSGSVAIDDYSLGWGGFHASGIKVYDDQKNLVAEITKLAAPVSLLSAARGNIDLGDTQITADKIDFRVFPDGTTSAEHIAKPAPPTPAPPKPKTDEPKNEEKPATKNEPIQLPNVKGRVTINLVSGKISGAGMPTPVAIDPSTITLNIPDINQPITNDIKLAYHVGDAKPSTISVSGTVDAVENGKIDPAKVKDTLKAQQKITLQDVSLAVAGAFVPNTEMAGVVNGTLDATVQGITGISANGELIATDVAYAGAALKDRLALGRVSIPIQVTRTQIDANNALIKIEKLSVDSPLLKLNVTGQVAEAVLQNLAKQQKPGGEGEIKIELAVPDFGAVARALPNTLKLQDGVTIERGALTNSETILITSDSVAVAQKLDVSAEGTRNQQRIALSPVHLETAATIVPNGKTIPDVSKLNLALTSAFATITGGGDSLAKIGINGNFDLAKLQSELAQFVDMGKTQLAGTGQFKIGTNGDVTNNAAPIAADANVNLANIRVVGVADQPVEIARAVLTAGGNLKRDNDGKPTSVDGGTLNFQSGDEKAPLVDVQATANIGLGDTITAPSFKLSKFAINSFAEVQKQYGGLVPALKEQGINLKSGAIYANVTGSFDGKTVTLDPKEPLAFSVPNIQIAKGGKLVLSREDISGRIAGSVSMADGIAANLTELNIGAKSELFALKSDGPLTVTLAKSGGMAGNGALKLAADLARLSTIAQAFGGSVEATNSAGQVTSGKLDGTLKLAQAQDTKINFDGQVLNLTVTANAQQAITNETVTIALKATATGDMKGVNVESANVASTFANASVTDAQLALGGAPLEMVTKANVDLDVPNLPAVYGLMQAFSPPTAAPVAKPQAAVQAIAPPTLLLAMQDKKRDRKHEEKPVDAAAVNNDSIAITSGSAKLKLTVDRPQGANATSVNLSEMRLSNLALARGAQKYAFSKDIALKLVAAIANKGTAVDSLSVNELSGDLGGVATLAMPEKITVTSPQDKPQANGAIKLDGTIDALTPLLAVLQGSAEPLPYSGTYSLTQKITTVQTKDGLVVNLEGSMSAPQFRMMENGKPAFEDAIEVKNNLGAYLDTKTATIRTLNISMPKSNALALNVGGRVIDWEQNRTIRDAKIDLTYDLATLWKVVFPMLSPEMREQYKELKVVGKRTTAFNIAGAFPNRPTVYESFKSLNADGAIGVELLDLPQGITTQIVDVPFKMTGGVLVIQQGKVGERPPTPEDSNDGKANGSGLAGLVGGNNGGGTRHNAAEDKSDTGKKPAAKELKPENGYANTGALNLAGITVDLTTPNLNVTIPKDKQLLQQVRLNPVLADSLGKIGAILFVGSSKAEGLINLRVAQFNRVPIGDLTARDKHANATLVLSVEDVKLSGVLTSVMAQLLGADAISGRIPDSTISIANGQARTDLTVLIDKEMEDPKTGKRVLQGQPLKLNGAVNLADLRLRDFVVEASPELLLREIRKYAPNGAVLPLTGFANAPKLDIQKFIAENAVKGLIPGSDKSGDGKDPIGDILGGLGGKKKDDGDKKKKK